METSRLNIKCTIEAAVLKHEGNIYAMIDAIATAILPTLIFMGMPDASLPDQEENKTHTGHAAADLAEKRLNDIGYTPGEIMHGALSLKIIAKEIK